MSHRTHWNASVGKTKYWTINDFSKICFWLIYISTCSTSKHLNYDFNGVKNLHF